MLSARPKIRYPFADRSSCILQRLMFQALTLRKGLQGRLIAYHPDMAERVDETSVPVDTPGSFVVLDIVKTTFCSGLQGTCDEGVRRIAEHL
jgi:hypothetical protein